MWRIRSSFSGQVGERRAEGPGGYGSPVFGSLWPVFRSYEVRIKPK